jgi:hypothetical protein
MEPVSDGAVKMKPVSSTVLVKSRLLTLPHRAARAPSQPVWKGSPGRRRDERSTSFVVSSERLTDDVLWRVVEPNHMISICRDGSVHFFAMGPDGLVAAARGTTDGHPYSRSGSQR